MSILARSWKYTSPAAAVALVLVTAVLLAGCGGTKTLSHQALVTKANQACQQADSAVSRLGAPTASLSALTGYATKVLPISEQLVTKLTALKPSSSDQTSFNKLVSALKNGNKGLEMMEKATTVTQTNAASQEIVAQSVPKAANAVGAASCASSPSA